MEYRLRDLYSEKEIAGIKKEEIKEVKKDLEEIRIERIKSEKKWLAGRLAYLKDQKKAYKDRHAETLKNYSEIRKSDLEYRLKELEKKWERQWGNAISQNKTRKRCPKGTRKDKSGDCVNK